MNNVLDHARSTIGSAIPSANQARSAIHGAVDKVQSNPLAFTFGSVAVGFLVGLMIPGTQIERERMGDLSDQLAESTKAKADEFIAKGSDAISHAVADTFQPQGGSVATLPHQPPPTDPPNPGSQPGDPPVPPPIDQRDLQATPQRMAA